MLRQRPVGPDDAAARAYFDALLLIVRDRAHASGRLIRRPWLASEVLTNVFNALAFGSGSAVELVQHSITIRYWFQYFQIRIHELGNQLINPVTNGRLKKIRFEAVAMCLQRTILCWWAFWKTMIRTMVERHEKTKEAEAWLIAASDSENVLLLAMMADGASQGLKFTFKHVFSLSTNAREQTHHDSASA